MADMPELPEVETIARELAPFLRGARLGRVRLNCPDIVRGVGLDGNSGASLVKSLRGRTVREVVRHGKRLMFALDSGSWLVFHLGMTGQLQRVAANAPCPPHTHLRIRIESTPWELRFRDPRRFGGVWVVDEDSAGKDGAWKAIGLSPLGLDALAISSRAFLKLMERRKQVKALLLDQALISGLGNIYVDESLFASGIHPLTIASAIPEEMVQPLWRNMRRILRAAIRAKGSTISDYRTAGNDMGEFQSRHKVYGRTGQACPRCGAKIARLMAAGRSSHVCPACQPIMNGSAR